MLLTMSVDEPPVIVCRDKWQTYTQTMRAQGKLKQTKRSISANTPVHDLVESDGAEEESYTLPAKRPVDVHLGLTILQIGSSEQLNVVSPDDPFGDESNQEPSCNDE